MCEYCHRDRKFNSLSDLRPAMESMGPILVLSFEPSEDNDRLKFSNIQYSVLLQWDL
jgi:hypothetical protein